MKKLILLFILVILFIPNISAEEVDFEELDIPKNPSYRLGTGSEPEFEYKIKNIDSYEEQRAKHVREQVTNKSYADSTLSDLSKEISKSTETDRDIMVSDIGILWAGAASKSETVKFTIYKLANPDADKPDDSIIKKVIRPLAGFSAMAGAGFLNPVAATTAIMSGALVNSLSVDDKALNYKYTKVTDADMIMLLKRIDDLQKRLISEYIDYMTALSASERAKVTVQNRYDNLQIAKSKSREMTLIADAYYRSALEKKKSIELD
ncbi:hypothetical protein IJG14_00835, partial [bacterium]|nr:hypothetical protein [bacterium]